MAAGTSTARTSVGASRTGARSAGSPRRGSPARAHVSRSLIAQVEAGPQARHALRWSRPWPPRSSGTGVCCPAGRTGGRAAAPRRRALRPSRRSAGRWRTRTSAPEVDTPPRSLDALDEELAVASAAAGRPPQYVRLGARLPAVHRGAHRARGADRPLPRAWQLLNRADAIAASLARRLGYHDLAQVAIERAAVAADAPTTRTCRASRAVPRLLLLSVKATDLALTWRRGRPPRSTGLPAGSPVRAAAAGRGRGRPAGLARRPGSTRRGRGGARRLADARPVRPGRAAWTSQFTVARRGRAATTTGRGAWTNGLELSLRLSLERRAQHENRYGPAPAPRAAGTKRRSPAS